VGDDVHPGAAGNVLLVGTARGFGVDDDTVAPRRQGAVDPPARRTEGLHVARDLMERDHDRDAGAAQLLEQSQHEHAARAIGRNGELQVGEVRPRHRCPLHDRRRRPRCAAEDPDHFRLSGSRLMGCDHLHVDPLATELGADHRRVGGDPVVLGGERSDGEHLHASTCATRAATVSQSYSDSHAGVASVAGAGALSVRSIASASAPAAGSHSVPSPSARATR
jgi:hypothetical protein